MMIEAMPIILPRDSAVIAAIRADARTKKVFRQTTFGNCRRTYGSSIRRDSVSNMRIAGVALTGLHGDGAVAAMGKTLELESGKRVLRGQEHGRAHKSDEPLFHNNPHASVRPHLTTMIFGVEEFFKEFAQPISRPETRDGSNYAKQAVI
jgi:hypothetical protein